MSDSEEEEVIVYASFEDGSIEREVFNVPDLHWKIVGLESETPLLQLGDTTFKGEWNDAVGTKLLFEEDPSPPTADQAFTVVPSTTLKYKCQTRKILNFSRIFLKPKSLKNGNETSENPDEMEADDDDDDDENEENEDEKDVLNLAKITIKPDQSTDNIMKDIAEETNEENIFNNDVTS